MKALAKYVALGTLADLSFYRTHSDNSSEAFQEFRPTGILNYIKSSWEIRSVSERPVIAVSVCGSENVGGR